MITIEKAKEIANDYLQPIKCRVRRISGEVDGKYVVAFENEYGYLPAGGCNLTVNKETGECKSEILERESLKPFARIKGFKVYPKK